MDPKSLLEDNLKNCLLKIASGNLINSKLTGDIRASLDEVLTRSESSKAVLTVVVTSIAYKIINPSQDVRNHQSSITDGYSGRSFDSKFITPFMKSNKFPAMAESGWLTRSLEQKVPYDMNYSGAIRPQSLKDSFLFILDYIQTHLNHDDCLDYLFQGLILKRNKQKIELAKPINLQIEIIIEVLEEHFNKKYNSDGAARLPVLSLFAAYQCLIKELKRFDKKVLLPLESHTSADSRSGRIGDIDIIDELQKSFESVEVKHGIPITAQLIKDSYDKFSTSQVKRYYILSTAEINPNEQAKIEEEIAKIRNIHGCQVIANGLIKSMKYYLRLISDTSEFVNNYVELLMKDGSLKFEHKKEWNTIISEIK